MTKGFYNLTSAMLTQGRYLDVISNNMSNVATAGFKTDRFTYSTFQEVMWKLVGNKDKEEYKELGNQSWITAPSRLYTDYSQGALEETGQPLDFAIEGEGFFGIETEEGRALTRNGNFSLDDQGYLCLPGQGRVLGANGNPIQLMTDRIATDSSGGIYTENGGFLGRIGVFMVNDPVESLDKDAHGLFTGEQGTAGWSTMRCWNAPIRISSSRWWR